MTATTPATTNANVDHMGAPAASCRIVMPRITRKRGVDHSEAGDDDIG